MYAHNHIILIGCVEPGRLPPSALEVHVLLADSELGLPPGPPLQASKTPTANQNLIEPSRMYKSVRLKRQPTLSTENTPPYTHLFYGFCQNVRCSRQCLLSSPVHRCSYIWIPLWFPNGSRGQSRRVASYRGIISLILPKSS